MFSVKVEDFYRQIVETACEGIWIVDAEMQTQFANGRISEMLGYATEEIRGISLLDCVFEEDRKAIVNTFQKREKGEIEKLELRFRRKDGAELWAQVSTNPIYDDSGKFTGTLGMFTDITDHKIAEENSRKNEEKYRAFLTQSSEGIWRIEHDKAISVNLSPDEQIEQFYRHAFLAECNDALAKMYGFESADEIIGARLGDLLPPDDKSNVEYLRAFINSNYRLEDAESHEIDRDGNPKIFLNNLIGVVENGFVTRAWGTQRDVTESKDAEEFLRESQAILAFSMQSSRMGVWTRDFVPDTVWWSEELEEIFGLKKGTFSGTTTEFFEYVHEQDRERIWNEIQLAIVEHRDYSVEFRFYHTDGSIRWMEGRGQAVYSQKGKPIRLYGVGIDITERKNAEEKLLEREERYRTLFNSIDEGFCILEMIFDENKKPVDYRFLEVNPIFEQLTGLKNSIGKTALELVPNLETRWFDIYGNVALTGKSIRFTEGSEAMNRWFDVYAVRVGGEESRKVALIFNDITERRKAEEDLRESEERFAKAFNSSPLALTISSLKTGKLLEVNDTFVYATGYTHEESVGRTTIELGLWANTDDREKELAAVQKQGEIRELEYRFRVKDGREIIGLLSAELLEIRGEPCALTVIQDITERKKATEISERYRLLSMRARDVILFFRPGGEIVDANQMAVEIYGYEQADLLKMKIHDLRAPEALTAIEDQLAKANNGGTQFETVHRRKNDTRFPVEVTSVGADIGGERLLISIIRDITERRKNEEIARQSAKQLALVTDIAPVYIAHCDAEKRFKFVNKAYAQRFGLKPGNCIGRPISDILGEAAFNDVLKYIEIVLAGQAVEFETEIAYPKIGKHFMHCSYAPEFDEKGSVIGWVAAITDISERRKMEEAVRESEKQLRQMADSMPQVVWIADSKGEVHYYNNRVSEFFGVQKGNDGTWSWQPIIHSDDLSSTIQTWENAKEKKEGYEREHRIQMADGNYRWHLSRAFPVFNEQGEIFKWYGTATDIHDLKQTENALIKAERRAAEEYLELLSRIVPIAQTLGTARDLTSIYRSLHDFVRVSMPCSAFFVSFFNAEKSLRTAAYVWGEDGEIDISTLPPMPLTKDGGPNSQAIFQKKSVVANHYWDLMKSRPHVVLQENGIDPNSSLVVPMIVMNRIIGTLEVQAYDNEVFTNEHIIALEMVANLAATAIENVRLLQVEADARETAEAANRAKDEFLSVLSHELRTPLNSMLGWVRMLRTGVLDEEKSVKAIEVIERNTLLQNNLIEDLLDVSRIISGKMRIEKEAVNLVKVFKDTIEILRPVAAQKKILLEFETEESSLIIDGDAMRFQQIIVNLAQNSVKFTPENGNVSVSLARNGDSARLIVKDDGIGISPKMLPLIFDRFRQADSSTKRIYSGLGLGLTIVRNLVELHGGTIEAESAGEGKGTSFVVEIPLTKDFIEKTASDGEPKIVAVDNSALDGARILLVDDDFESLIPLQLFLEREQAEIVLATSAKDALEKLSQQNFNVLITDIGMPITDGYDLIAKVRQLQTEHNAFITAIALTAYASSDDRRRALASGFQEHFAKPVDYDELLVAIKRIYEVGKK